MSTETQPEREAEKETDPNHDSGSHELLDPFADVTRVDVLNAFAKAKEEEEKKPPQGFYDQAQNSRP